MTKRRLQVSAVLVLAIALTGASCDQKRAAAVALNDFASALVAFETGEIAAHKDGFVSDQEHQQIQVVVKQVAQAGSTLTTTLKNSQDPTTAITSAIDAVAKLNDAGVLHVKNQETKTKLTALVLALKAPLVTLQSLYIKGGK